MASSVPPVLTITVRPAGPRTSARMSLACWSVHDGRYGSLWTREVALDADRCGDVAATLRAAAEALLDSLGPRVID